MINIALDGPAGAGKSWLAHTLAEKLGFIQLGTIKHGFKMNDGTYEDICPYYIEV